ncbi:transcription termination factor NusA [Patescibacteria group bacterium]|nr:transcription termination factor NusA [Patescibacteria group bacterium]MBU0964306.1 transcription termination factor NusA [Patescibacteria group bacterium]
MATNGNDILQAAKQICEEKNISLDSVIETIEAALAVAYRKDFGEKNQNIKVELDMKTASSRIFDIKTVVTDEKAEITEKLKEEKKAQAEAENEEIKPGKEKKIKESIREEDEANEEQKIDRFNPKTEITLTDANKIKKDAKLDEVIKTELHPPAAYGRMAAQTAKQVIIQRLREAERDTIYKEFKDKEGEVINGTIQRIEGKMVLIDLGPTTALLPPSEQVPREQYSPGQRLKFFVVAVNTTPKGPEIILSRSHPDMVNKLFHLEVPEIGNGSVEIKSVAREAGSRTKIAVFTNQKNIDPVGSCVGQRGSRVQTIISEIGGEKIDIIEWDEDPAKFITNSLSPAKVLSVKIKDEEKAALAEVKEDQLSLAIGKAGQNVRLSAKLSGWKIDIISDKGDKVTSKAEKKDKPENSGSVGSLASSESSADGKEKQVKEEVKKDEEKKPVGEEKSKSEGDEEKSIKTSEVKSIKEERVEKKPGEQKKEDIEQPTKDKKAVKEEPKPAEKITEKKDEPKPEAKQEEKPVQEEKSIKEKKTADKDEKKQPDKEDNK